MKEAGYCELLRKRNYERMITGTNMEIGTFSCARMDETEGCSRSEAGNRIETMIKEDQPR